MLIYKGLLYLDFPLRTFESRIKAGTNLKLNENLEYWRKLKIPLALTILCKRNLKTNNITYLNNQCAIEIATVVTHM